MQEPGDPKLQQAFRWFGAAMLVGGLYMIVQGIAHIRSGAPIPGNRWLAESTGWDTFIAGLVALGLGAMLAWRGFKRRE